MLELIVARAKNGGIGLRGKIPWHIAEDFKHFKETTMGSAVVMGRKTWESIGRPLPGRTNVVLTRDAGYVAKGAFVKTSLEQALRFLSREKRVFIIGGAALYAQALSKVQIAWVTEVDCEPEADAFFPSLPETEWTRVELKSLQATDSHPGAVFYKYTRIHSAP